MRGEAIEHREDQPRGRGDLFLVLDVRHEEALAEELGALGEALVDGGESVGGPSFDAGGVAVSPLLPQAMTSRVVSAKTPSFKHHLRACGA